MALELSKIQSLLNDGISVLELRSNRPACEEYILTRYVIDGFKIETMIPYVYRRSHMELTTEEAVANYLNELKPNFTRENVSNWYKEELDKISEKDGTYAAFLRILLSSYGKEILQNKFPQNNNAQKIFQTIKDNGFIVSILRGNKSNGRYTRYWILPLPLITETKYENMSKLFVQKAIKCLGGVNVYEGKKTKGLLPDHKFSEIRWDRDTPEENSLDMSEADIRQKFQLLDTQRNQQKREVCRNCFQNGIRGSIYGIKFYYAGNEYWDESIPKTGKEAEKGCIGCPWYDIAKWREELHKIISGHK